MVNGRDLKSFCSPAVKRSTAGREGSREPDVLRRVGQKSQVPGPLQGDGEAALVLGAGARLAARLDLPAVRQIATELRNVLVVDLADVVDAEGADLAPGDIAAMPLPLRPGGSRGARLSGGRARLDRGSKAFGGGNSLVGRGGHLLRDCFWLGFDDRFCARLDGGRGLLPGRPLRLLLDSRLSGPARRALGRFGPLSRLVHATTSPRLGDLLEGQVIGVHPLPGRLRPLRALSSGMGAACTRSRKRTVLAITSVRKRLWPS